MNKSASFVIRRILSIVVDFNLIFIVGILLSFLGVGFDAENFLYPSIHMFTSYGAFLSFVWFLLASLFKDVVFGNASIGKRIFKLHIEKTNGTQLTKANLVVRNLTALIFQIEILVLIVNQGVRIGDMLAHTKVVSNPAK